MRVMYSFSRPRYLSRPRLVLFACVERKSSNEQILHRLSSVSGLQSAMNSKTLLFALRIPDAMLARSHWYPTLHTSSSSTCLHTLDKKCPTKLEDTSNSTKHFLDVNKSLLHTDHDGDEIETVIYFLSTKI